MDNFLKKAGIILVMILVAALSQGAKTHAQDLPIREFSISLSSLLQYKQETLYWLSYPGAEKYQVWYSNKPESEYQMIQELEGYETSLNVSVQCSSSVYFYMEALDLQGTVIARSNMVARATYPCLQIPDVSVVRRRDFAILTWERDLNVSYYSVAKVNEDESLTFLRIMERVTTAKIQIPCGESWKIQVIPYAYGRAAEFGSVQVYSACSMRFFPLVNNATGQ